MTIDLRIFAAMRIATKERKEHIEKVLSGH